MSELGTPPDVLLGRVRAALVERYRVEAEIGHGGMAVVFRAHDVRHDRPVAIKVLRPELAALVGPSRFAREIRIAAQLQHPHIVPLHEAGAAEDLLYYVMPYVAGESLRSYLQTRGALPYPEALEITREVADALDYAHRCGVVHRDIKPANMLLSAGHALVADFGIARAVWLSVSAAARERLTQTGAVVGTPEYMSPEQAAGHVDIDGRSDLYSLGCVLYEMLTGRPPFTGATPQAIMAQQLTEPPPSPRAVHAAIPRSVDHVVTTALATEPSARYATGSDFAAAAERARVGLPVVARRRRTPVWWARVGAAATGALLAVWIGWRVWWPASSSLEANRIVVFPLRSPTAADGGAADGEGVATYIGYALDGTEPLRWIDGWSALSGPVRSGTASLAGAEARAIAVAQRAAHYIEGSIVRAPDSVTVLLALHDVPGDSVVARAGASAPTASASLPRLGVRAVAQLLPAVVEPGRRIDLSALADRNPTAIAHFLEGEREYRRMHFPAALAFYRRAVGEDSSLAVAALKGAQAASWQELTGLDSTLVAVALRRPGALSERQMWLARGLRAYLHGAADPALDAFHHALAIDSTWAEAYAALGEVYYHLVPRVAAPDTLAEHAFRRAQRVDPDFTPPLYHLAEIAIRRGNVRQADQYLRALRAVTDTTQLRQQELMLRCVRDHWTSRDWAAAARAGPMLVSTAVLRAGKALATGAAQPVCAGGAFAAVLDMRGSSDADRWGALLGAEALFAATGQQTAFAQIMASRGAADLPAWSAFLLAAAAGAGFDHEADSIAATRGARYAAMGSPTLWLLGVWAIHRGHAAASSAIATALAAKADSTHDRRDSMLVQIVAAHMALASGDSAAAVARLRALVPSAARTDIEWQPWESLGLERLTLAQLLAARGEPQGAWEVASELDAPAPVIYPLYLRPSLVVRLHAAQVLGRADWAAVYRTRLALLDRVPRPK